jgi:Caspase domain
VNWAVVIGVDDYGRSELNLTAAVADAERFCDWVRSPEGGNVAASNLRLLLGRAGGGERDRVPTKDNIVTAINEVVTESGGTGERLFVFFAGHGLTARVSNRDESALVTPGFDELHTDHSLAVRSLTEFLETTQFEDQFFFLDACRDVPWRDREFEIGRWPIPRRRDPGKPPVQQFILHATPPGLTAAEVGWPGEAVGAFTDALMGALAGEGRAKAWSWERACYEVRWENLARYVKEAMESRRHATSPAGEPPPEGWPIQVPQDAGARGVAGRDRDALLASFSRARVDPLRLEVELLGGPADEEAEISVLDAVGEPVATAVKVQGSAHTFTLPPKTYAVRAKATDKRAGRLKAPVDLYEDTKVPIKLEAPVDVAPGEVDEPLGGDGEPGADDRPGTIVVETADPLTVAELRDEAGNAVGLETPDPEAGRARFSVPAGFYRLRLVGPEPGGGEQFVVLAAGEEERLREAKPPPASERTLALATAAGGRYDEEAQALVLGADAEPLQWGAPSTILAVALGEALAGDRARLDRLGLPSPAETVGEGASGVAVYAVGGDGVALPGLSVRLWSAGAGVPGASVSLEWSEAGVAGFVERVEQPGQRWLALEQGDAATVLALPVLAGRVATVVAQVEPEGARLYQLHPAADGGPSSSAARLRRVEHLERLLLAGRLDGARPLAEELAACAPEDPFAGLVAAYVLLRLGLNEKLPETVEAVLATAPELSDAYIVRGEFEASAGNQDAASQAFADAVNAGVPAFGEGLTRLVEGLRAIGFLHPRAALVRHIFQRHARGSMWAAFAPRRPLEAGGLVISGADLGFEG